MRPYHGRLAHRVICDIVINHSGKLGSHASAPWLRKDTYIGDVCIDPAIGLVQDSRPLFKSRSRMPYPDSSVRVNTCKY
jgi:hypothetical protein